MVDKKICIGCGACASSCPVGAITIGADGKAEIDKTICINCGTCQALCPVCAIDLSKK